MASTELSNRWFRLHRYLCVGVPSSANDNDPVNARFAWGGEILEGGFGGDREDLPCGLEADHAFERWNGVLAVRRDKFRDLVLRHALFLKGCVGQLLADVVGHLNDHPDRIRQAGLLHSLHHVRSIMVGGSGVSLCESVRAADVFVRDGSGNREGFFASQAVDS